MKKPINFQHHYQAGGASFESIRNFRKFTINIFIRADVILDSNGAP